MSADSLTDGSVIAVVLVLRLAVPLLIPRFPLPALLASLIVDGVDGGILSALTDVGVDWYQSFDKALDVYYLAITYLAVRRNWPDRFSVALVAALWYYRLVGVLAFELTGARWLLLVFPNTFEYVVIAVEAVRTRWNPLRISRRALVVTAAVIWVVVKLPQEWWIHVAQLDATDEFARVVLGVDPADGWAAGFRNRPWVAAVLVALAVVLVLVARWAWPRLPRPDWPWRFDADAVSAAIGWVPAGSPARVRTDRGWPLVEKVVLTALLTVILVEVYPGPEPRPAQVVVVVALVVLANAALVARTGGHGRGPVTTAVVSFVVNAVALVLLTALVGGRRGILSAADVLFFAYVITLVVVLSDRYVVRRAEREVVTAGP
ncbi:hypothetical protein [Cellulomonas olei]|uniref:hypothetical protein n=1 Tax=Cellulomonas sp. P4 TaxID=3142533 RepID=UPI0031BA5A9D